MQVRFTVEGKPIGYDRAAARLRFTPREVRDWRAMVATSYCLAASESGAPWHGEYIGPVTLTIDAYGTRADADNAAKEVMDGLKGSALRDDCQVVELLVRVPTRAFGKGGGVKKPADECPRVEVVVDLVELAA